MGGTIDGEGISDIQRLDSLLSLSPDDEQLYSSWQYLYRAIGMCNKSLDMIDLQSVRLTDNQKAQFKAEVRAIRAMMYYEAMDLYGRIPVFCLRQNHSSMNRLRALRLPMKSCRLRANGAKSSISSSANCSRCCLIFLRRQFGGRLSLWAHHAACGQLPAG